MTLESVNLGPRKKLPLPLKKQSVLSNTLQTHARIIFSYNQVQKATGHYRLRYDNLGASDCSAVLPPHFCFLAQGMSLIELSLRLCEAIYLYKQRLAVQ